MEQELPQEKLIVGLVSFGLGLILSGQFLFGLVPLAAGVYFYIKNRAAYAELEKRLTALLGAKASTDAAPTKHELAGKAAKLESSAASASIPADNWYYERAGAAIGPFKESDIRDLILKSELTQLTLVYNPVFGNDWRKLENTHFAELAKRKTL